MNAPFDRRGFLKVAAGAGAAAFLPIVAASPTAVAQTPAAPFRIVHLSDIHVQPELSAARGMAKALQAVEDLNPKPDFILTGGDQIFDALEQDEARSRQLFKLFDQIRRDNTGLRLYPCLGNHDVFGWSLRNGVTRDHVAFGKRMYNETWELPRPYYTFDHRGWRFYVLDTIQPTPDNRYEGGLDDEQMAWFEADLRAKPREMPALVVSHIPILTVTGLCDRLFSAQDNQYRVPTGLMCQGSERLTRLLAEHGVRLALSGHIHELDRIELRGVTYICDGAVSGNWWKGSKNGYQEGFGIVDLKPDGVFEHRYHDYGWEAQA